MAGVLYDSISSPGSRGHVTGHGLCAHYPAVVNPVPVLGGYFEPLRHEPSYQGLSYQYTPKIGFEQVLIRARHRRRSTLLVVRQSRGSPALRIDLVAYGAVRVLLVIVRLFRRRLRVAASTPVDSHHLEFGGYSGATLSGWSTAISEVWRRSCRLRGPLLSRPRGDYVGGAQ